MLYQCDCERDDDQPPVKPGKSRSSERRSFRLLSSVCSCWHQTLTRWPEALTSQWVKHQIKKMIERKCRHKYYASVLDYSFSDLRLKTICCKLKTGLGLYTV